MCSNHNFSCWKNGAEICRFKLPVHAIERFNEAWDFVVNKLMLFVESEQISSDAWSSESRNIFKLSLSSKLKDSLNVDYFTAVQTATFRLWRMNRVSDFSLLQ